MLYAARQRFERLSIKIGLLFSKLPLSPNHWTLLSLLPAVGAAYLLVEEQFLAAALLFIATSFLDMVDGAVARATGTVTKLGAYLDTVVDRYVEAMIVVALLFVPLPELGFLIPIRGWILIFFFGSVMTTYSKAAAKEKGIVPEGTELKGGLLERAERLIVLFIGIAAAAIDPIYLSYVIVLLAFLTNLTALQRIWIAKRMT